MITILGFDIQLPEPLQFLNNEWGNFAITVVAWLIVGFVVYPILALCIRWLTRRTETEIDDVILGVSRNPFLVMVIIVGAINSLAIFGAEESVKYAEKALHLLLIVTITYWIWKFFREVVMYYGQIYAERTETSIDDVLVPIADQLGPIIIFVSGATIALQYLGVSVALLVTAIGGTAFIMAFALQDILSNVFSGLSLLTDTPFKYGDLIVLQDGTICEVKKIGLRVTQLYSIGNHSVIYMPNSKLANERLVNITRPSPDLIVTMVVGVGYHSDLTKVREILEHVVNAHTDVLGNVDEKLKLLEARLVKVKASSLNNHHIIHKLENGMTRLKKEHQVDEQLGIVHKELSQLATDLKMKEKGGLLDQEIREIEDEFLPIMELIGTVNDESGKNSLIGKVRDWIETWMHDPDLELYPEDKSLLLNEWDRRIRLLSKRVVTLKERIEKPNSEEQRLHNRVETVSRWLKEEFKVPTPKWKHPDVNFTNFGESSLDFELEIFIDDIHLEHFERQDRVISEIRQEIIERFREAEIEIPFPQRDVWFRRELKLASKLE